MPEPESTPDGLEAMAFQLLLHKVTTLEHAVQSLPPLLTKIIEHLEAQGKQEEGGVATYAQLYPELQEGEAAEKTGEVIDVTPTPQAGVPKRRRVWRWFTKDIS